MKTILLSLFLIPVSFLALYAADVSAVYAYPVPFQPARGDRTVTFSDVPNGTTIYIYASTGELVQTIYSTYYSGAPTWNGTNSNGATVASGIYVARVENGGSRKIIKLIILR